MVFPIAKEVPFPALLFIAAFHAFQRDPKRYPVDIKHDTFLILSCKKQGCCHDSIYKAILILEGKYSLKSKLVAGCACYSPKMPPKQLVKIGGAALPYISNLVSGLILCSMMMMYSKTRFFVARLILTCKIFNVLIYMHKTKQSGASGAINLFWLYYSL